VDRRILSGSCPSLSTCGHEDHDTIKDSSAIDMNAQGSEARKDMHRIISCRTKDGDGIEIVLSRES
jgi:hypothetical protein